MPRDKYGKPILDENAKGTSHTQLGTRDSKSGKGKYPQTREFDKNDLPVWDTDFTDHGHPDKHPDPHQHKYKENSTGGTRQRSDNAEPLEHWNY